ncbi:hypothetical protein JMJ35_009300 [Cladonia borealis]|uniref:Uncharacterized protein n=1 Tax=Cladonia borealis TaxID=184061 RepID=A0AA39QTP0_9LECA|nr:hypothetical protein JMJ35_009300 [Cladonia borealis]
MRKTSLLHLVRLPKHGLKPQAPAPSFKHLNQHPPPTSTPLIPCRALAQVRPDRSLFPEIWFTSSTPPLRSPNNNESSPKPSPNDHPLPDERTLKLGKTLRILQSRLPTLLASPLPPEILSPHITLHLFPSTHPHLPTVSGRVAYHAALWTFPMAWGRVPIVGNVRLDILSERITRSHSSSSDCPERLIVRWKTCGKTKGKGMGAFYKGIGASEQVDKITEWLGGDARDDEEFCGLFIFEFDGEGRILEHTIEHVVEGGIGREGG